MASNNREEVALLTPAEVRFLKRQLRYGDSYLFFCFIQVLVALGIMLHMTIAGFDGSRFGLAIVLLLYARSNLKQFKNASLLKIFYRSDQHRWQERL